MELEIFIKRINTILKSDKDEIITLSDNLDSSELIEFLNSKIKSNIEKVELELFRVSGGHIIKFNDLHNQDDRAKYYSLDTLNSLIQNNLLNSIIVDILNNRK